MNMTDFVALTAGGIFYTKLDEGDVVNSIVIGGEALDLVVYSDKKALRFPVGDIPIVKRAARGVKSIGSKTVDYVDGMCLVAGKDITSVVVVTRKGYINKFNIAALPQSQRSKSGNAVIKLGKNDIINSIHVVSESDVIRLVCDGGLVDVPVNTMVNGSSVSTGNRMIPAKDSVIKSVKL